MTSYHTSVPWRYIDKKKATVKALRDYPSQKQILETAQKEMADIQNQIIGLNSVQFSDMPKAQPDPTSRERRIVIGIDRLDLLRERYCSATEFVAWFTPAWDALSDDERFVLSTMYMNPDYGQEGGFLIVQEKYFIERTAAYKRCERALSHLSALLYGV